MPPSREEVDARLARALDAHYARVDHLAALCAPLEAPAPPPPTGWLAWLAPAAPAPDAEARLRAAWKRAVVLRDRASRVRLEQDALAAQLVALDAWSAALDRDGEASAAAVIQDVRAAIATTAPLLDDLASALDALGAQEEAAALAAEQDLRAGRRPVLGAAVDLHGLDDVVHRLRAHAVPRAAVERPLADRLPIEHAQDPSWQRATDEVSDAQDPLGAWRRSR